MQHYNPDDLIDHFLKRKLNAEEAEVLKNLIATDPRIAEALEESVETYHFLQYLRYRQIKNQLQEFDMADDHSRKLIVRRRWAITAMILVAGLMGSWVMITSYYNPENLAGKNIVPITFMGAIPAGYSAEDTLHMYNAYQFVKMEDYQNASRLWHVYSQQGSLSLNAKWNAMMCYLAMHGPDALWNREMTAFLEIADNPYFSKGEKIHHLVNSTFYKFIYGNSSSAITALKPRLI